MRKNPHILITAALVLMLAVSAVPVYAVESGAVVGAPPGAASAGTSAETTAAAAGAASSAQTAAATTAAETKSAWESAAALEEVEKSGFVPALPVGDSIFSTPGSTGQAAETSAARTTAAETTAARTTAAETTGARTTAAETRAPETTEAETTKAGTKAAETKAKETDPDADEVVGAAPTEAASTEAETTMEAETTTEAETTKESETVKEPETAKESETTKEAETSAAPETKAPESSAVTPETTAAETSPASSEQKNMVTPETAARTGFPAEMATNGDMPDPDSTSGPGMVRAGNSGVKEPTVNSGSAGTTDWGSVSEQRERIVEMAESFIGGTYTYGGMSPETGFDCSGLVKYVLKNAAGISLPRTSAEQAGVGREITASEMRPGDLIAYDGSDHNGSVNHISIYVGDGMAVHAVGTGKGIRKTKWDYQPAMTIRNVMGD